MAPLMFYAKCERFLLVTLGCLSLLCQCLINIDVCCSCLCTYAHARCPNMGVGV